MTLTTDAKDYMAGNLGRSNCFASSGVSYTDPRGGHHTGSTADVVKTMKLGGSGPGGEGYYDIDDFRLITDSDLRSLDSITWCVGDGDGGGGTSCNEGATRCNGNYEEMCINGTWERNHCTYGCTNGECNSAPSTSGCTPGTTRCNRGNIETCNSSRAWIVNTYCSDGCEIRNGAPACSVASSGGSGTDPSGTAHTGPFEVSISAGVDCAGQGEPHVSLDTSKGYAYFKSAPITRIGMSKILIQNDSGDCRIYLAWEMRMWDNPTGAKPTRCPTGTTEVTEINRYISEIADTKTLAVSTLPGNTTIEGYGQFEIPSTAEGKKIVCFTLWGNYSKQALLDELATEGYAEDPLW